MNDLKKITSLLDEDTNSNLLIDFSEPTKYTETNNTIEVEPNSHFSEIQFNGIDIVNNLTDNMENGGNIEKSNSGNTVNMNNENENTIDQKKSYQNLLINDFNFDKKADNCKLVNRSDGENSNLYEPRRNLHRKSDSFLCKTDSRIFRLSAIRSFSTCIDNDEEYERKNVSHCLANQLISEALDNFKIELTNDLLEYITKSSQFSSSSSSSLSHHDDDDDDTDIAVETLYLPKVDILHGNLNLVEAINSSINIETDASREPAESRSFNLAVSLSVDDEKYFDGGDSSGYDDDDGGDDDDDRFLDDEKEPIMGDVKIERLVRKKSSIDFNNMNLNREEDLLKIADQIVAESMLEGSNMFQNEDFVVKHGDKEDVRSFDLNGEVESNCGISSLKISEFKETVVEKFVNATPQENNRPTNIDCPQRKKILPDFRLLTEEEEETIDEVPSLDEAGAIENEEIDLVCPEINIDLADSPSTPGDRLFETGKDEESNNIRWRRVNVADKDYRLDVKVIEPYKKILSHGGYYGNGFNSIIVFCTCYLPDKRRKDYRYVMDNLFLYAVSTLESLVADDYMIVFFHGATPNYRMPPFGWLKKCYTMISRRLKKNLKRLLIVHPTLWLKTLMVMAKPFISSKFRNKLDYVKDLNELDSKVNTEHIYVPDEIKEFDKKLRGKHLK